MVKLVDILLEAEVDAEFRVLVKEFTINPLNKDVIKEEKEQLNEAILPLIIGGFLSFPKLIQFLGKTKTGIPVFCYGFSNSYWNTCFSF